MTLAAVTGGKALWYLTRGTGLMALVLLTASMLLGIVELKRWQSPRWPRFVTAALHRYLSLLSVAFVAVHVSTTVFDSFAPIGWLDTVIPFRSPYRPIWLGLGAVAVDLLIALVITSILRVRLGYGAWRIVHWAAYACWPVALVHGLGTGTDIRHGWAIALNCFCLTVIVGAVWWRLSYGGDAGPLIPGVGHSQRPRPVVISAAVASVVVPVAVVAWLLSGPLQPGWAKRAGTPIAVRSSVPAASTTLPASGEANGPSAAPSTTIAGPRTPESTVTQPSAPLVLPASTALRGRVIQAPESNGQSSVTIDATLASSPDTQMVIVLQGNTLPAGGIEMHASQVTFGPPAGPAEYQGKVTALQGNRLNLAVVGHGEEVALVVRLTIAADVVTGTMTKAGPGA